MTLHAVVSQERFFLKRGSTFPSSFFCGSRGFGSVAAVPFTPHTSYVHAHISSSTRRAASRRGTPAARSRLSRVRHTLKRVFELGQTMYHAKTRGVCSASSHTRTHTASCSCVEKSSLWCSLHTSRHKRTRAPRRGGAIHICWRTWPSRSSTSSRHS